MARVRFPVARTRDKSAAGAYLPDERLPGMYRLKRTDGSLSDMVNLTRAKNALDDGLDVPEFLRRAPKGRRDMILANKKCPATKDRANLKDTRSAACTSATASAQQENAI
jgi:hypothetical protein